MPLLFCSHNYCSRFCFSPTPHPPPPTPFFLKSPHSLSSRVYYFHVIISAFSLISGVSAFFVVTFLSQQARSRQGVVYSFVAVVVNFLIPTFVGDDEAFGYSLRKGWCWISSNACNVVCDNVCMRIHTCLSLLHSHLLVWVSVSPFVVDFHFENVYCWDLASMESFVFFSETRTTHCSWNKSVRELVS